MDVELLRPRQVARPLRARRRPARAVIVGFALLATTAIAGCSSGSSGAPAATGSNPSATLTVKTVDATVATPDATVAVDGHTGQSLATGDTVTTDQSGFAQVTYPDGSLARLGADTSMTITSLSDADETQRVTTTLSSGELWNNVKTVTGSQGLYQVDTKYADATVRDPQFIVGCAPTACTFAVYDGAIAVAAPSGGPTVTINAGQTLTATANGLGAVTTPPSDTFLADPFLTQNLAIDSTSATPASASAVAQAGSYSGDGFGFYVSADGKHVQDVAGLGGGNYQTLQCTPSGSFTDASFNIPAIAIAPDGSFSAKVTQSGVEDNSAARITYTFSGHFHGTSATGSLSEDVTYRHGAAYSCTTGTDPVTLTRDTQGSQAATVPPAGSYSGDGFGFYVSADGKHVQDVAGLGGGNYQTLQCTPSGSFTDASFNIPAIAIAPDGSFSAKVTQSGVEDNSAARITYTFSGHFHGVDSSGDERVAGSVREDVTYKHGAAYSCTTGTDPVTLTRDTQGSQAATVPPAGSYSGDGFGFYVSADGKHVQDVAGLGGGNYQTLQCTPSGSFTDASFNIPAIAIAPDGSFSAKVTQSGVEDNSAARITYTFSGHFHGVDSSGDERVAGSVREDVTYRHGAAYSCTTGTDPVTLISS